MEQQDVRKTGTTTMGLVCKDGLVLAADKRATAGFFIAAKKIEKIIKITDEIAVTVAGTVSDIQLLAKIIKAELKLKQIRTGKINTVKEAANLLSGIVYSNIRKFSLIPGISHFIMGGKDKSGFHIYDLSPDGSVTEIDDFVSSGSGSEMVYGLLETVYTKDMPIKEAVKLAIKGINAALQRDAATGNGITVYTITEKGAIKIIDKELEIKLEA
jgi:proteasome beta subunit